MANLPKTLGRKETVMQRAERMVKAVSTLNERQSFRIGRMVKFLTENDLIVEFNAWDRAQDVKEGRVQ